MRHEEDNLQVSCIRYLRLQYPDSLFFHVPNGGKRNPREGARFKKMGVLAGVSDILILDPKNGYNGLCVELKTPKGAIQKTQKDFMYNIAKRNWKVYVCRSIDDFITTVDKYFNTETS